MERSSNSFAIRIVAGIFEIHPGVGQEFVEAGLDGLGILAFDLAHDFAPLRWDR